MVNLRTYQTKAIEEVREKIRSGQKRVVFYLSVGAGKGLIMSEIVNNALNQGKKVLTVMRRRELIFQTMKNYEKYHGIKSSQIMAGTKKKLFNKNNPSQICSIDTLRTRIDKDDFQFLKDFDIIILDEAQDSNSETYKKFFDWMGNKIFLGFTGTAFNMPRFWESFVKPIEPRELRDQGFLAKARVFAPSVIDTSEVHIKAGEFNEVELTEAATKPQIIGDIVKTYQELGEGKPALLFAINKKHSAIMSEAFRLAGIPSVHIDESHTSVERAVAIRDLTEGKIKVLCNVGVLTTGVDIPIASVGIMARPTMSETLWIQSLGRVLRPHPSKEYALILDHAGNTERHGHAYLPRDAYYFREKKKGEIITKTCPKCFAVLEGRPAECEFCGHEFEKVAPAEIEVQDGNLTEINTDCPLQNRFFQLKRIAKEKGHKAFSAWFKIYKEYGDEIFQKLSVPLAVRRILENSRAVDQYGR